MRRVRAESGSVEKTLSISRAVRSQKAPSSRSSCQSSCARRSSALSPRARKKCSAPRPPTKVAKLSLKLTCPLAKKVVCSSSCSTVFTSVTLSAFTVVLTSGSLNHPSVLKALAGPTVTSYPSALSASAVLRAAEKSKKPLYGNRPTTGNHQVLRSRRSGYAADTTSTSVSRSSGENVVKLSSTLRRSESAANCRASSTRANLARNAGSVDSRATSRGMGWRRARMRASSYAARDR